MKYDLMGLLRSAAMDVNRRDGGTAYALLELANNLRMVMRKEATIDELLGAYTGHEAEAFDIEKLLPIKR